jgi:hypothetical protein
MRLKSILCPIDFSESSVAAHQYALSLAEYFKARLVALHVIDLWKYAYADYAAQEADYAKLSHALSEGGEVRLRQFLKSIPLGEFSRNLPFSRETLPIAFSRSLYRKIWK